MHQGISDLFGIRFRHSLNMRAELSRSLASCGEKLSPPVSEKGKLARSPRGRKKSPSHVSIVTLLDGLGGHSRAPAALNRLVGLRFQRYLAGRKISGHAYRR